MTCFFLPKTLLICVYGNIEIARKCACATFGSVCVCVFATAAFIISVSWVDRAGAQQVRSLIPIPLHLPVCPSMFAQAHCVLHRGTPGLCCTRACCPVLCLTAYTHTHTHAHTHMPTHWNAASSCYWLKQEAAADILSFSSQVTQHPE